MAEAPRHFNRRRARLFQRKKIDEGGGDPVRRASGGECVRAAFRRGKLTGRQVRKSGIDRDVCGLYSSFSAAVGGGGGHTGC
jgi:hypothetical protein